MALLFFCCFSDPPRIRLNSSVLSNQTELVLTAGFAFNLSCHGIGPTQWWSTAFRIMHKNPVPNPLLVSGSNPRHTGTYHCGYTNQSMEHLSAWIHLYVKDPADPSSVFVTPHALPDIKDGQDFLFRCLLTDPSVTNLTLQSESREERGRSLPLGMNVTFDPRRGALIRKLQISFNGKYVCAGLKDGRRVTSAPLYLRLVPLPCLTLSQLMSVRLIGEMFQVTCLSNSASHLYSLSWTHPRIKPLDVTHSQHYRDSHLFRTSTVTVPVVNHTHRGAYTCKAVSEAGVTMATTHLRVLDRPYLKVYLQLAQQATANTRDHHDLSANISGISPELQVDLQANSSRGLPEPSGQLMANVSTNPKLVTKANSTKVSRRVEVYEDGEVMLTFVTEAYPPIREQHWIMPTHVNANNTKMLLKRNYTANGYRSESSLVLQRVRQEDRGLYSFHFSNDFFNGSRDIDLRVYRSPSVTVRLENDFIICSSSGFPLPTIQWYTCPGIHDTCGDITTNQVPPSDMMSQEEEEVTANLSRPLSPDDVTIECVSYNQLGESRKALSAQAPPPLFTHALIGALGSVAILLLLSLVLFVKWRQKPRYEIRWKIIESTDGNTYTFVDPTQLPYNQKWEFPRDKLRLGPVLGSGAFGKVVEATAYGLGTDNNVTRVAVKMLKPSAHSEERDALMSELKILSHLGYHHNIVNLLGACTRGGPMLMITEYCSYGDLLNFLRAHSQDFVASILTVDEVEGGAFYKNMEARLRSDSGISCCSEYQEMQPALSPGQTPLSVQMDSLSVGDLMRFSFQVAQGLDFLSTRNCIHRDVAARNVLLTDSGVAKICDFGLARDIRNDDSYIVQGNARLPVKWMAPESIFQCLYTVQSDVWSYGVLLWEIFSLGKSPYPNVVVDTNFYKMIKDGRHMDQPDYAPAEMYELMRCCWSLEPTDRPTFKMIGQIIDRLHPSMCHCDQMYKNVSANEEEVELTEEDDKKRGEEVERIDRHDNDEDAGGEESVRRNIYQLS